MSDAGINDSIVTLISYEYLLTGTAGATKLRVEADVFPGGGAYRGNGSVRAEVGRVRPVLVIPGFEADVGRPLNMRALPVYPVAYCVGTIALVWFSRGDITIWVCGSEAGDSIVSS